MPSFGTFYALAAILTAVLCSAANAVTALRSTSHLLDNNNNDNGASIDSMIVVQDIYAALDNHHHDQLPYDDTTTSRALQSRRNRNVHNLPAHWGAATDYIGFADTTNSHKGNCGDGPVDSKRTRDDTCADRGGACAVGWTERDEWLAYKLQTSDDYRGKYDVTIRVASRSDSKRFKLSFSDGPSKTFDAPGRGYDDYVDVVWRRVELRSDREYDLRVEFVTGKINVCAISIGPSGTDADSISEASQDSYDSDDGRTLGPMRLRMWWQRGYVWQEETFERLWCLECDTVGECRSGDMARVRVCDNTTMPLDRNTIFELQETEEEGEVIIRELSSDMCLTTKDFEDDKSENTKLRPCDGRRGQTWETRGYGDFFDDDRFEIHPVGEEKYCLTTHHFPKDAENARVERCGLARDDTASYWTPYYL